MEKLKTPPSKKSILSGGEKSNGRAVKGAEKKRSRKKGERTISRLISRKLNFDVNPEPEKGGRATGVGGITTGPKYAPSSRLAKDRLLRGWKHRREGKSEEVTWRKTNMCLI